MSDSEHSEDGDVDTESAPAATTAPESSLPDHVPLKDLVLEYGPWKNPRRLTGLSDESIDALATSIASHTFSAGADIFAGIQDPLLVVLVKAKSSVITLILDGQRRYLAANRNFQGRGREGGDVLIPVRWRFEEPVDLTPALAAQLLAETLETAGTREGLASPELVDSAISLRESINTDTDKPYTLEEIGTKIGRGAPWISRMITAVKHATPKLRHSWETGEISDEKFLALAAERDQAEQERAAAAEEAARKAGDKATARAIARETQARAKSDAKAAKKAAEEAKARAKAEAKAAKAKKKPDSKQAELPTVAPTSKVVPKPEPKAEAPKAPKPMSRVITDEYLSLAKRTPPTHDYVKGVMHGIAAAAGAMDPDGFAKPWHAYVARASGKPQTAKKGKGK